METTTSAFEATLEHGGEPGTSGYSILDSLKDLFSDVAGGAGSAVLSAISQGLSTILDWLYELIFFDLFGGCKAVGSKVINHLFDTFSIQSISFSFFEIYVGFIFVIFALRMAIHIIRG